MKISLGYPDPGTDPFTRPCFHIILSTMHPEKSGGVARSILKVLCFKFRMNFAFYSIMNLFFPL